MINSLKTLTLGATLVGLVSISSVASAETYQLDPGHTSVVASWSHFGYSHPVATFDGVTGTLVFTKDQPEDASVKVSIPIKTIDSGVPALNKEFKDEAYFDVRHYPDATFISDKVVETGDKTYDVQGKLTIKGHTEPVTLKVSLNGQGKHPMEKVPAIGFDATTTIQRSKFGIDQYVPHVSDDVKIRITTEGAASK